MKNKIIIASIIFSISISFFSCSGVSTEDSAASVAATEYNSKYFKDVVSSTEGEFVGLELGNSKSIAKSKLSSDAFQNESEEYLYYFWNLDNNDYYLDLFFDEDKLAIIDGYIYFLNAAEEPDMAAATDFYEDMKKHFLAKYGEEDEIVDADGKYIEWYFDNKEVELRIQEGDVFWYISSF